MDAETHFQELSDSPATHATDQLYAFFDSLPAVDTSMLRGEWEGGVLRTGHRGEKRLGAIKWVGKTFHSDAHVDPIVSRGETGGREVNAIMGGATLRKESHRGVETAVMVYNDHPIKDYFRRVTDNIVVGVMHHEGETAPLFFYLRRIGRS